MALFSLETHAAGVHGSYGAGVAVSSSVLTIAVLSADRLLAVRRPLSLSVYRASRYTWLIVAGVWTTSLAVAAPLLDVRRLHVVDLGFGPHNTFTLCLEVTPYSSSRLHALPTAVRACKTKSNVAEH